MTARSDSPADAPATGRTDPRSGYRKTVAASAVVAAVGGALGLALALHHPMAIERSALLLWLAWSVSLIAVAAVFAWAALLVTGGMIAIRRDGLEAAGQPYVSAIPRESRPARIGGWLRPALRRRGASSSLDLRPGEHVEIRSLREILATLDSNGTHGGLPFMPEMVAYCGQRTTVFRRVDKLNDWVHGTGLKRTRNIVQLEGLRCTGAAHGACQANCRLRWKEAWLRRADASQPNASAIAPRLSESDLYQLARRDATESEIRYMCQATELTSGAEPLAWSDPRHVIRDLITGNIRLRPFLTGVSLACFNWVQKRRGGAAFPYIVPTGSKSSPTQSLGLRPGDLVRVKSKRRIEATLNERSRNRGLWFDREMLRYCGGEYRVRSVLEQVIVEGTGALRRLTIPCIVLDGVRATGEYQSFNPEDEHIFWREIWLERVDTETAP